MSSWECTYRETLTGDEYTKTCYSSCCETDCCDADGSGHSAGLYAGIGVPVVFFVFFLLFCCRLCMRRQTLARQNVVAVPTRGIIITRTTVTNGVAPRVPEHQGYDQPNYRPSTMPSPAAEFQPPPPYTEQTPKADVV